MGGAGPSGAELEAMQREIAQMSPEAIAQLPPETRELIKNLPKAGDEKPTHRPTPTLPGLGGGSLPGLPGGKGLPGLPGGPKGPFGGGGFPFGGKKK